MSESYPAVVDWEAGDGQPLTAIMAASSTPMNAIVYKRYKQFDATRRRAEVLEACVEMRELEQVEMQVGGWRKSENGGKNVA